MQLIFIQASVFQDVENQQFVGVLEEALHQVANLGAGGFGALDQRRVDEGATVLGVGDVALLLQDSNGRQYRVVGQKFIARKVVQDLLDGGRPALPEDFHQPQLGFGQGRRSFRRH